MSKLLHIAASPRGEASESLSIARHFLDSYRSTHLGDEVETWDLWDGSLPEFGPTFATAKMTLIAGGELSAEQAEAWQRVQDTFARFNSADRYLFSVPLWNHGVPYILKQFIDVVTQAGTLFTLDANGYGSLLEGKKAALIYTGAVYGDDRGPEFGLDFQQPFMNYWLRFAGVSDITEIAFRPNLLTDDADIRRQTAQADARDAGKSF